MRLNHPVVTILALSLAYAGLLAGCTAAPPPPAPTPSPSPAPPPAPAPRTAAPRPADWRDAPASPGDWRWTREGGSSVARFGGGALELRCEPPGTVVLLRAAPAGLATGSVPMTILTTTITRPVAANARPGPPPVVAASFGARDPLLDAMAFSRGRFAVETAGMPTLYVPSWTEVSRVVEDCRTGP